MNPNLTMILNNKLAGEMGRHMKAILDILDECDSAGVPVPCGMIAESEDGTVVSSLTITETAPLP